MTIFDKGEVPMTLLILGLALIILILVIVLCSIHNSDIMELEIEVIRPWKFKIKIIKKDKPVTKHKKHKPT